MRNLKNKGNKTKPKLIDKENRLVDLRGEKGWEEGKMVARNQEV